MCALSAAANVTQGGLIKGSGSYAFADLMTEYLHSWQAQHNDTTFTYSAVGDAQGELSFDQLYPCIICCTNTCSR
jgi:ABC-type phosphate transport system substrate-binding protein